MAGNQGFASMDANKQRKIASEGGKASHSGGNSSQSSRNTGSRKATGAAVDKDAQRRGGEHSHGNQYTS